MPVISLSAADIYSPFVGDAEAEVRRAFSLARQASPCMLFIDELDSIVTNRASSSGGTNNRGMMVMCIWCMCEYMCVFIFLMLCDIF